jgi:small subunit ribosomal protein S17
MASSDKNSKTTSKTNISKEETATTKKESVASRASKKVTSKKSTSKKTVSKKTVSKKTASKKASTIKGEAGTVKTGTTNLSNRGRRKIRTGVVVSDKMEKTIVVKAETSGKHSLYGKIVRKTKKFYVDDRDNEAKVGDLVKIAETRPLSKKKRWRLLSIVEKAR